MRALLIMGSLPYLFQRAWDTIWLSCPLLSMRRTMFTPNSDAPPEISGPEPAPVNGGGRHAPEPSMRTIAFSSLMGTTVEWFDFFAYSTAAALIINSLFFPDYDPIVGTILAFGGIAVGYFGRPLGSIVFGHFGDRIGRKTMLVLSLMLMGGATFAIGLLPTYSQIGVAAPLLLMSLRFVQGFALGGEWGGAVLIVVEHAPARRRGLYGSVPQIGLALGLTLATLIYLGLTQLPDAAFASWGWRVPFLASAALVIIGLLIRMRISETPEFQALQVEGRSSRMPIVDALRTHWREIILAALSFAGIGAVFYMLFTFSLTYGTEYIGFDRGLMLMMATVCSLLSIVGLPIAGWLADTYGARKVFGVGSAAIAVTALPSFWLIDTGNAGLAFLGYLLATIAFCAAYGTLGVLYADAFDARVRYTGISLALGLGTILGSAFVPIIYLELLSTFGGSWAISVYMIVAGAISLAASALLRRR